MANKVNKIRKLKVKRALLENKPITQAMQEAGYSEGTSNHGAINQVYKEALSEIKLDFAKQELTVETVKANFRENRALAKAKGDLASMNTADTMLGKIIAAFTDKQSITVDELTDKQETYLSNRIKAIQLQENKTN